jgi:hypothetical protein
MASFPVRNMVLPLRDKKPSKAKLMMADENVFDNESIKHH